MGNLTVTLKKEEYGYLLEFKNELNISINNLTNEQTTKLKVRNYVDVNNLIVENRSDFDFMNEKYQFEGAEVINEMDMFDVDRPDITKIGEFKKAPDNAHKLIKSGKTYFKKRLKGTELRAERDPLHQHEAFDNVYKFSGISKNEKAKKSKVE